MSQNSPGAGSEERAARGRRLRRLVMLKAGEGRALAWSGLYFFCLLFSYYLLRPAREQFGIRGDLENLPWLWTATSLAMLGAVPVFGWVVSRWPRRVFIPWTYRFLALNALVFAGVIGLVGAGEEAERARVWTGYVFYVWLSVFNLFAVSVFWGFMADAWNREQGARLFGLIGVGGTLGAIAGSAVPALLAEQIGVVWLIVCSAAMLECAARGAVRVASAAGIARSAGREEAESTAAHSARTTEREPGPKWWMGLALVARSRYLQAMALYMLLFTLTTTFLYFEQAAIVKEHFETPEKRTAFFARIDLAVNVLTLATQLFITGRLMRLLGVGAALCVLPVLTVLGFAGLWAAPAGAVLGLFFVFQVARRGLHYAIDRPAREVLYTVLGPEEKYKSKSFIDTFVYRAGDLAGAWMYAPIEMLGAGMASLAGAGVAAVWLCVGAALGVMQGRKRGG
ncbi:MAG TPA: Npt1/Npt2 family nucleotide transporter [Gemmatimonadales bacterium]|nr:Npt1/Npt2 family nucleotide transporter [Gemmatimonadales bacterium]